MRATITTFRAVFCLVGFLLIGTSLEAQQVPLYNQYYRVPTLAYSSASVFNKQPKLSLVYRQQFSNVEGSPSVAALSYSSELGSKMGFGGNLMAIDVGLIRQVRVLGLFAYKFIDNNGHQLALGASLGYSSFNINEDIVNPDSYDDPVLLNLLGNNGSAFNADVSLSYRYRSFSLDFAAPNLVNGSISGDQYLQVNEDNTPDFIAGINYSFILNGEKKIFIIPNVTWRYKNLIGNELDILAKLDYNDKFSVSGGYRHNYGGTFGVGLYITKNLEFTYNHDFGKKDVPFLNDGYSEFGLHMRFKSTSEKRKERYEAGEAVYNKVVNENIYDPLLLTNQEQNDLKNYLYSMEETGKKRERRARAEVRYVNLFEDLKAQELTKLEVRATAQRQARQDSIDIVNAEREWQKAYQIAEKQRTESRSLEEERKIHEGQNADAFYERATNAALDKMPEEEQQRIREINKLVSPDRLRELGNGEHTNNTVGYDYIVVVASYLLDSRQSRVYLNSILDEFEDSKIYASRKRKLDYVYIDAGNNYESIMARMKQIREDTHFKNAWVHIVRLSELIGQ